MHKFYVEGGADPGNSWSCGRLPSQLRKFSRSKSREWNLGFRFESEDWNRITSAVDAPRLLLFGCFLMFFWEYPSIPDDAKFFLLAQSEGAGPMDYY